MYQFFQYFSIHEQIKKFTILFCQYIYIKFDITIKRFYRDIKKRLKFNVYKFKGFILFNKIIIKLYVFLLQYFILLSVKTQNIFIDHIIVNVLVIIINVYFYLVVPT